MTTSILKFSTSTSDQKEQLVGDKVWCPHCQEYINMVRATIAAKVVDVDRRTIYNYTKQDKVFSVKLLITIMIEIDDLQIEQDERGFLNQ